jgi:hypothetical protein
MRIPARFASIKRAAVIRIEWQPKSDTLGQVWIGDEVPTEGHQVSVTLRNDSLGCVRLEAACGDNLARENLPKGFRRDWLQVLSEQRTTADARLDYMKISKPKVIELTREVPVGCLRIAVGHAIEGPARRDANPNAVRSSYVSQCLDHFNKEWGPVFNRAAVVISALIAIVLEELVE